METNSNNLLIPLSEEALRNIVRDILLNLNESYTNIFSISDNLRNNPLMEGYFRTYPLSKVEKFLKQRYGNAAKVSVEKKENGEKAFHVYIWNDEKNKEIVDKDMSLCGYYPSITEISSDGTTLLIVYEPRFQNKVNEIVKERPFLYHVTKKSRLNKILANGLSPRTENKLFVYPDRIYFFLNQPSRQELELLTAQLKENDKGFRKGDSYVLIKVSTQGLKNNFFFDPNTDECVYTKENIPPQFIIPLSK